MKRVLVYVKSVANGWQYYCRQLERHRSAIFSWYNRNIVFPKTSLCSHQCNNSYHFDFQQLEWLCFHPIQFSHHWKATIFVIRIDQSNLQLRNHYHRWQFQVLKPHWSKSKSIRFHFQVWLSICQMIFGFPNHQLGSSKNRLFCAKNQ